MNRKFRFLFLLISFLFVLSFLPKEEINPFDFRTTSFKGKIELQLNNDTLFICEDMSLAKWLFKNDYKAGNYLAILEANAFSRVKYCNLSNTYKLNYYKLL